MRGEGVNSRRVYQLATAAVVGAIFVYFIVLLLFNSFARERPGARLVVGSALKGPLEIDSGALLLELRKKEESNLNRLGWIDRATGTVRIPIGRAMAIIVERNTEGRRAR